MAARRIGLVVGVFCLLAGMVSAQGFPFDTPFDFKDSWYKKNGIDPDLLVLRLTPDSPQATKGKSKDKTRNKTRLTEVNTGFDSAGAMLFYPGPPSFVPAEAFLDNEAGVEAKAIAEKFRAFIFPLADGVPLVPALANRRQDNMFDTSSGYLSANPLGLWRITFVSWTDAGKNSPEGIAKQDELKILNGTDLDGTAVIRRLAEINELEALGFIELATRPEDGSSGAPWVT